MKKKYIIGWCFQAKEEEFEPIEGMNNDGKGTRWYDGYGIWGTKKALLDNVWNEVPKGYKAVRVKIYLVC